MVENKKPDASDEENIKKEEMLADEITEYLATEEIEEQYAAFELRQQQAEHDKLLSHLAAAEDEISQKDIEETEYFEKELSDHERLLSLFEEAEREIILENSDRPQEHDPGLSASETEQFAPIDAEEFMAHKGRGKAKKKSKPGAKRHPVRKWAVPIVALVLVVIVIFLGLRIYKRSRALPETAQIVAPGSTIESKEYVAGAETTPEYATKLREYEKIREKAAEEAGATHIPSVLGTSEQKKIEEQLDDLVKESVGMQPEKPVYEPPPEPEPAVAQVAPVPQRDSAAPQTIINKRDPAYMAMVQNYQAVYGTQLYDIATGLSYPAAVTHQGSQAVDKVLDEVVQPPTNTPSWLPPAPFEVGNIIYAVNEVAVNSDVPGPVMVEVLQGPQAGGKFIGQFTVHAKEKLLIKFNRFIDTKNQEYSVNAYAVDPTDVTPDIRSRIKRRTFSRWAALVAASFIEGFGTAMSQAGSTTTSTLGAGGEVTQTTYPEFDTEKQAWMAAGKVGETLAPIVAQQFTRPPTVYLDRGAPVGVLIISVNRES